MGQTVKTMMLARGVVVTALSAVPVAAAQTPAGEAPEAP